MALDERERLELRLALVEVLGPDNGNRLMDQVPPFDWADVAMKSDLVALEERLNDRFGLVLDARLGKLYWAMLGMMLSMTAVTAAVVGVVVSIVV